MSMTRRWRGLWSIYVSSVLTQCLYSSTATAAPSALSCPPSPHPQGGRMVKIYPESPLWNLKPVERARFVQRPIGMQQCSAVNSANWPVEKDHPKAVKNCLVTDIIKKYYKMSGEPQVLCMRMRGFDDDTVKENLKEEVDVKPKHQHQDGKDSPDSSSRYVKI